MYGLTKLGGALAGVIEGALGAVAGILSSQGTGSNLQENLGKIDMDGMPGSEGGTGLKGTGEISEQPSAKGLTGKDFEDYLHKIIGGESKYIKGSNAGRDFDGVVGNRWYEAKSGNYWNTLLKNKEVEENFKRKMVEGLRIAQENGATYELFSNSPIPNIIKEWLTKKGIPFTEILY